MDFIDYIFISISHCFLAEHFLGTTGFVLTLAALFTNAALSLTKWLSNTTLIRKMRVVLFPQRRA